MLRCAAARQGPMANMGGGANIGITVGTAPVAFVCERHSDSTAIAQHSARGAGAGIARGGATIT